MQSSLLSKSKVLSRSVTWYIRVRKIEKLVELEIEKKMFQVKVVHEA